VEPDNTGVDGMYSSPDMSDLEAGSRLMWCAVSVAEKVLK